MKKQLQPTKVISIHCPKCGEIQIKLYPWSTYQLREGDQVPPCKKCMAKQAP